MSSGKWLRGDARDYLSPTEREVLKHFAQGKNDIQIGMALNNMSEVTVRQHLKNARRKLHVTNRVQLALKAITIITPPKSVEES